MPHLAVPGASRRERRLSLRTTAEERQLIERAALIATAGDVTRFVMRASLAAAQETVDQAESTRVSDEMRDAFYRLLLHPPQPNAALLALAENAVPEGHELVDR
jgi:uncharacterized protein (DUF1778 family)